MEVISGFNAVEEVKQGTGKDKVLVVQPFGRSVETVGQDFIADASSRSFSLNNIVNIINDLKKDYSVIIMSEIQFPLEENEEKSKYKVARPQLDDQRMWAAIINAADHFLGCDSMGQHLAMAFDKTATVVTGSTYPINISYPDHKNFDVIDAGLDRRKYSPIRLTQAEEVDRYNDQAMELSKEQEKQVTASVRKRMGKSTAYTNYSAPVKGQGQSAPPLTSSQSYGVPATTTKPQIKKPTKGFLDEVKTATQQTKVDSQVKEILGNLK